MVRGFVKWFDDAKGVGFISPADGGEEIFFHHTAIQGSAERAILSGQAVHYEAVEGANGYSALNVQVAEARAKS